jgi:hypothetical protein
MSGPDLKRVRIALIHNKGAVGRGGSHGSLSLTYDLTAGSKCEPK